MARVLIFNPEPSARATLQVLLELESHECGVAETSEEAFRQMSWQHFDLVVIDTHGVPASYEFARMLRATGNQTPVLFLGDAWSKPVSQAAKVGGKIVSKKKSLKAIVRDIEKELPKAAAVAPGAQLKKPFEVSELLTAINHLTITNSQRLYSSPSLGSGLGRLH